MCVDWLSLGVTVYVYAPCRPSESGCSGPCLLCPQPTAVLPGEGLTLPSVQPGVHRMFPRRCLRRHPLPWATLGSGPRRPGRWGWGHSLCGGGMSGPRNEGGGGWGGDGPNRFRLIPAPPLTSWVPVPGRGWTDGMNPMASERLGGAWTAPQGLTSAGHPAPRPGRQEEPGSFYRPSPLLCSCAQLWKQSFPSIIHLISQCRNKLLKIIPHFQMGNLENQRAMRAEAGFEPNSVHATQESPSQLTNSLPSPL